MASHTLWTIGLERSFIFSNSLATGVQNVPEMRDIKSSAVGGNKDQDAKDSTPLEQRIETAKKDTLQDRQLLKGRVPQGRYWRNSFSNLLKILEKIQLMLYMSIDELPQ